MTAALASCTKELSVAPSAEGIDSAISLGEGMTITGTKGNFGVDTKAVWGWNGEKLVPLWSDKDQIGAAFYNYATYDAAGKPTSNRFTQFMTNFYFNRTDTGVKTQAEFQSPTNMMAGAYVLYFPYNPEWTGVSNNIPVVVNYPQTMDIDAPYAHLSDDMFSCVSYAALEGGTDLSSKFQMQSVTNVLSLNFKVNNVKLMELAGKIDIAQVYIETAAKAMYSEGSIAVPKDEVDYTKALADPREGYVNNTKAVVNQVLVNLNKTSDDYTISKTNTPTEYVHVSTLPFDKLSKNSKLYVKVVTSDGRVYSSDDLTATDTGLEYLNKYATAKGTHIPMTITLTTQDTGEIYTEEEFKAQWNAAVAGTEDVELTVGTDLVVKDFPMTKGNEDVTITITGENGATLTVEGDLTLEDGTLNVDLPLTVKGDFIFGNNANIEGTVNGTLSVTGQTTIDGAAANTNITIVKMNDVAISRTGEFKINGEKTTKVGKIVNRGKLTLENIKIESLENKADNGSVHFEKGVVVTGTLDSYGATSGSFTNHGTVNLFAASEATIENAAAIPAQGLSAGVINVKETLTSLNVKNSSLVVVDAGKTITFASEYQDDEDAVIDATATGASVVVNYRSSTSDLLYGEIVANANTEIIDVLTGLEKKINVRYIVNDNKDVNNTWLEKLAKNEKVNLIADIYAKNLEFTPILFGNANTVEIENNAIVLVSQTSTFYSNVTVKGNATIKGSNAAAILTLDGNGNGVYTFLVKNGTLTFDGKFQVAGNLTQEYNTAITFGKDVDHTNLKTEYKK